MLWGMVLVTTAVADATVVARNMQPQRDLDIEGIPVNNNDFLRISEEEIDFDYWSSTAVRAKGKSCEKAGGKCMLKKTVKKMCKGKVDKKSKCDKKNYICCISDETTSAPLTCPVVTCEPCQTTEIITEESVNQCVGENKENSILWNKVDSAETILKATINEGNYNATGAIEIKIHNLEMELQLMKYNIADGNSKLDYLIKILDGPTKKSTTRAPIKQTPTTLTSEAPTTKSPTWTPTTQAPTFITSEAPITVLWRDDARCGPSYPLPDGRPAQCHPDSFYGCCSPSGWCGHTPAHCTCSSCIDYRGTSTKTTYPTSTSTPKTSTSTPKTSISTKTTYPTSTSTPKTSTSTPKTSTSTKTTYPTSTSTPKTSTSTPKTNCLPSDAFNIDETKYAFFTCPMNYYQARDFCQTYEWGDWSLATPDDHFEQFNDLMPGDVEAEFWLDVRPYQTMNTTDWPFINGTDWPFANGTDWFWQTSPIMNMTTPEQWISGVTQIPPPNCASLVKYGGLLNYPCSTEWYFVCQADGVFSKRKPLLVKNNVSFEERVGEKRLKLQKSIGKGM